MENKVEDLVVAARVFTQAEREVMECATATETTKQKRGFMLLAIERLKQAARKM